MPNAYKKRLVRWDIETGAESEEIVRKFYKAPEPFSVEACKKEFATARKPGAEGEAFVEKKRAEHAADAAQHWLDFLERAGLKPTTGRIFAIGLRENGVTRILTALTDEEEKAAIAEFLRYAAEVIATGGEMEGFNTDGFDLPFLFRRALKYRLDASILRRGRYWHEAFRDLLAVWQAGNRQEFISLELLAEFLGTEHRKNGDGAFFAVLFKSDPAKALAYLDNDLLMTEEVGVALTPLAAPSDAQDNDVPFAA
jgi:hypothetical protein